MSRGSTDYPAPYKRKRKGYARKTSGSPFKRGQVWMKDSSANVRLFRRGGFLPKKKIGGSLPAYQTNSLQLPEKPTVKRTREYAETLNPGQIAMYNKTFIQDQAARQLEKNRRLWEIIRLNAHSAAQQRMANLWAQDQPDLFVPGTQLNRFFHFTEPGVQMREEPSINWYLTPEAAAEWGSHDAVGAGRTAQVGQPGIVVLEPDYAQPIVGNTGRIGALGENIVAEATHRMIDMNPELAEEITGIPPKKMRRKQKLVEFNPFGEQGYETPGAEEYEAHKVIEPILRKQYEQIVEEEKNKFSNRHRAWEQEKGLEMTRRLGGLLSKYRTGGFFPRKKRKYKGKRMTIKPIGSGPITIVPAI